MTNSISPDSTSPNVSGESGVVGGSGRTQPAAPALGRKVPEWKGKTPDSKVPENVKLRIFNRYGGRCYLSGRLIRAGDDWQIEHIKPLIDGGEHAEFNLAPALTEPHKVKTKFEARRRAKERRVRKKHFGMHEAKHPMPGGKKSREKITWGPNGNKIVIDRITGEQIWPRINS